MSELSFETRQIHAGQSPDTATGARALPIYQTTSYVFDSAETAANRFALADLGPIYTRIGNPTVAAVEDRIADLEGGVQGLLVASGQSAEFLAIINIAEAGDHVVASPSLYGGTYNLLDVTLRKLGIETTFVSDPGDVEAWKAAVKPNTKLFFAESVANPRSDVLDIAAVAETAHAAGVPLIIDNTLATPYLVRPIEHGADVVIHSATKYLGGHGTSIAGIIVDSGNFDYGAEPERFPGFNQPDDSYNGLVFARDLGPDSAFGANVSYGIKARVQLLRDLGPAASPFNAFLIAQGLETLSLRIERHVANAQRVAEFLESHAQVDKVHFAGLPSSPWYELGQKYLPKGVGSVLGFEIADGYDAAVKFVDALELHSHVANIGDVRSLVIHPASTTHAQLDEDAQRAAGVSPAFVRLAVGIEGIDDIIADLEKGFAAARG
ncbi:bifunctional o-acetylhomoserine/o-acetylserine sulfhydrylase [Brevibacterium luteolum]|uniref:bifunctional o-acetylhomoserine/o-acetylserine sulfhydrylase n=1 Tax=Brevibacterium luteolum TaxID=199591 RepID=UPI0021AE57D8|nr:bifunctional o-acetylhomoserine/o-acetylserine sulfhydrylase [Brevibacterium luteolum]MCT1873232.1 bifunctional o-acetylhomoserine/o-acetylserine sulfhydrylase [Brevibacterium luteolum]MCT1890351.1 bifunctional o-acetylhomoserine/o-acetylserine sulfhydrylase [Brevibacterium luteolum]MCT1893224.1 bifunctional o-acetylhomoserine/o-acetylserine sulfhydrylase [Brevibacterium luteolum]MCT1924033.1 bifunctional o-acetylhomoserine/o-acetylserine sulfhydrylase [Brevibacterium luteolum]